MFDVISHRNWVVNQLYLFAGVPIVPGYGPRPSKPFVTYTITSPYIPQSSPPEIQYFDFIRIIPGEIEEDLEEEPENQEEQDLIIENWIKKHRIEYPRIVWSFTSVSDDMNQSFNNILKIRRWFELDGKMALQSKDIVVARVEPVTDRSLILEEIEPEYRTGFDIMFRVISDISIDIEPIESVEYSIDSEI